MGTVEDYEIDRKNALAAPAPTFTIGVGGYSAQRFDVAEADRILAAELDRIADAHPGHTVEVVSGLTDVGIPARAYRLAAARGWRTVGVACSKAGKHTCYPVDERVIVGDAWGDESPEFLSRIDVLVLGGGGGQARREAVEFAARGMPVYVRELEALPA